MFEKIPSNILTDVTRHRKVIHVTGEQVFLAKALNVLDLQRV